MLSRTFIPLTACLFVLGTNGAIARADDSTLIQKSKLFVSRDLGFTKCRIPGIVVTRTGTLIAWCECRMARAGDWDPSILYISRSTDGGNTWETPRRMYGDEKQPFNNPVMIADRDTGTVHFFFCTN
jgi:sialidase-1